MALAMIFVVSFSHMFAGKEDFNSLKQFFNDHRGLVSFKELNDALSNLEQTGEVRNIDKLLTQLNQYNIGKKRTQKKTNQHLPEEEIMIFELEL